MRGVSASGVPTNLQSLDNQTEIQVDDEKSKFANFIDDMYNSLVIEHGVVTTDYSH